MCLGRGWGGVSHFWGRGDSPDVGSSFGGQDGQAVERGHAILSGDDQSVESAD
jgi:hypothetical protein